MQSIDSSMTDVFTGIVTVADPATVAQPSEWTVESAKGRCAIVDLVRNALPAGGAL